MNKEALLEELNEPEPNKTLTEKEIAHSFHNPNDQDEENEHNTTKTFKNFRGQPLFDEFDDTVSATTLMMKCIPVPQVKVQPYLFHNALFNPQFDIFNPVFGLMEKKSKIRKLANGAEKDEDEEIKSDDDDFSEKMKKNGKKFKENKNDDEMEDVDLARLFATFQSLNSAAGIFSKRLMAHVPLKRTDVNPGLILEEEKYEDLENEADHQKSVNMIKEMYRQIMLLLFKIICVIFIFDVIPIFAVGPSFSSDSEMNYLYGRIEFGTISFSMSQEILNFFVDILTYVIVIFLIKRTRTTLQSQFQMNLNPDFKFGVILSNLPETATMYDIIKISRKLLGPNYGIVDIVMVNDYSELEKAQNYVKEKEMLYWDWEKCCVYNVEEMSEEDKKSLEEVKKQKILEEKKIIKLGSRFKGAAIVIFQTQEMSEKILKKLSPFDPLVFYSHHTIALINGSKITVEELTEPRDLLWENLGADLRVRKAKIIIIYPLLVLVMLAFFYMIELNKVNEYVVYYAFPFVAVFFCFLIETPIMFLGKFLKFPAYSAEMTQMIAFSFILFLVSLFLVAFRAMPQITMGNQKTQDQIHDKYWYLHFTVGAFLAIAFTTPFKRIWNKNFLSHFFRQLSINYKKSNALPFSRLEYEKSLEKPIFDWIIPLHSIMMILSYLFVVKEICFYGCFFACVLVIIAWAVDSFFINSIKIDLPTIMVIKAFFKILDVMIIMLAFSNGLINVVGSIAYNSAPILGILWFVFIGMWIYYELSCKITINCFDFQVAKSKKKILEATNLKFLPERKRRKVINIDRNLEFANFVESETIPDSNKP